MFSISSDVAIIGSKVGWVSFDIGGVHHGFSSQLGFNSQRFLEELIFFLGYIFF